MIFQSCACIIPSIVLIKISIGNNFHRRCLGSPRDETSTECFAFPPHPSPSPPTGTGSIGGWRPHSSPFFAPFVPFVQHIPSFYPLFWPSCVATKLPPPSFFSSLTTTYFESFHPRQTCCSFPPFPECSAPGASIRRILTTRWTTRTTPGWSS